MDARLLRLRDTAVEETRAAAAARRVQVTTWANPTPTLLQPDPSIELNHIPAGSTRFYIL